jgi:hypothetical protein
MNYENGTQTALAFLFYEAVADPFSSFILYLSYFLGSVLPISLNPLSRRRQESQVPQALPSGAGS